MSKLHPSDPACTHLERASEALSRASDTRQTHHFERACIRFAEPGPRSCIASSTPRMMARRQGEHCLIRHQYPVVASRQQPARAKRPLRSGLGDLPPHPRRHLLPQLLLDRRRHPVGRQPPPQGSRQHVDDPEVDPRLPPGRRPDLRDPGQPLRAQGHQDPHLGPEEPGRAVLHPDERFVGEPD